MSLINKMLQDLDARGSGGAPAVEQQEVKPCRRWSATGGRCWAGRRRVCWWWQPAAWYGWQYWQAHNAPAAAPVPAARVIDNRIPDQPRFQEPPAQRRRPAASGAAAVAPSPAVGAPAPERAVPEPPPKPAEQWPKRVARSDMPAMAQQRKALRAAAATPATGDGVVLRELTPKQMSENSYRRALAALQKAVSARRWRSWTSGRTRSAQRGCAPDLRQPAAGKPPHRRRHPPAAPGPGIDPRQPDWPWCWRACNWKGRSRAGHAAQDFAVRWRSPDYHAFLAGVLQREQRHAEAAQHYRDALQLCRKMQCGGWDWASRCKPTSICRKRAKPSTAPAAPAA
jgi:MSHA biogenesis protein MshN